MNNTDTFKLRLSHAGDGSLTIEGHSPDGQRLRVPALYPTEMAPPLPAHLPQTPEQLTAIGHRMRDLLLPGPLWDAFSAARQHARQQGHALRLCLNIQAPALASWPWELVTDPAGHFLALNHQTPIVRCRPEPTPAIQLSNHPTIQPSSHPAILLANTRPSDQEQPDEPQSTARQSLQPLLNADRLSADLCRHATPQRLAKVLANRPYTILHLIGDFPEEAIHPVANAILGTHLGLIILQTYTPAPPASASIPLTGLTQTLMGADAAAVLTVPAELETATGPFLSTLYATLAAGHALDRAVTEARIAAARTTSPVTWAWALTVLLARDPGLRLWPLPTPASSDATPDATSALDADADIHFAGQVHIEGDLVAGNQAKQVTHLGDVGVVRDSQIGTQKSPPDLPAASPLRPSEETSSIRFEDDVHVGGDMVAGDQAKHETRTGDIGIMRRSQIGTEGDDDESTEPKPTVPAECPHCAAGREAGYRYCDKCGRPLV